MTLLERNTIRRLSQWFPTKKPKPFRDSVGRLWKETEGGLLQLIQDGCDDCGCETGTGTGTGTGTSWVDCGTTCSEYYLVTVTGIVKGTDFPVPCNNCSLINGSWLCKWEGGTTSCTFCLCKAIQPCNSPGGPCDSQQVTCFLTLIRAFSLITEIRVTFRIRAAASFTCGAGPEGNCAPAGEIQCGGDINTLRFRQRFLSLECVSLNHTLINDASINDSGCDGTGATVTVQAIGPP